MNHRVLTVIVALVVPVVSVANETEETSDVLGPADRIVAGVSDPVVRDLLSEVLDRSPEIATLEARALASNELRVSVRRLPDPQAELTAFVLPPETRVGPQRFAARLTQQIPGGGKRKLAEHAADLDHAASAADIEGLRLGLVTRTRSLMLEIAYLDEARRVLNDHHAVLDHFEGLARARYASGVGLQMDAIQIQAEMTRIEVRQTELAARRATVAADVNQLRDRPGQPIRELSIPRTEMPTLDWSRLRGRAVRSRPELAAHDARIGSKEAAVDIAAKRSSPDFSVGLVYAMVDRRRDIDVPDNGQDVFGISGGITIPIWKSTTRADVEAATQLRIAGEASRRAAVAAIERELEDLRGRIPELQRRLRLMEEVLPVQSEQALASAESAYAAGRVDALSLLDAERVLLDVRLTAARSRADLAIALIALEGAVGQPLVDGGRS